MGRRKYRRRGFKLKLKKDTVYTLSAIGTFLLGSLLLFSFTKSSEILAKINLYLESFFGFFSFLIPINFILFSLLLTKIKASFTRPNISIGFLTLTICILGLFKSGFLGQELFSYTESFVGSLLTTIFFIAGLLVGFFVSFNLSISQITKFITSILKGLIDDINKYIIPVFRTKRQVLVKEIKPITIKDSKEAIANINSGSLQANKIIKETDKKDDLSDEIIVNKPLEIGVWEYPPVSLLSDRVDKKADKGDVKKIASTIEKTLQSFGIQARVAEVNVGPSVTQYAIEIALGTKLSKITALANDLALATEAPTGQVRIEAPIPGRNLVGIEIPNKSLEVVSIKTILLSNQMQKAKSKLAVPLGLDVSGAPVIIDLAKMPHVLVAGTTGSGKSVLINSFISSLLFRTSPYEVKLIMIDPKRVELTGYNNIPHLMVPVVVEADQSVSALKWALKEMDRRYIRFAESGVKNIDSYNELSGFQALPYIVIFIDELADLMALAPVEVEDSIARLAQMARATGIHLVLSTQRPSVDVITGLIKANIPCRIAFSVSSMVDSKVIIDSSGAEKLLGRGDMLYVPPDQAKPTRIQGSFVSEQDIKRMVNFIKARGIPVQYTQEVVEQEVNLKRGAKGSQNIDMQAGAGAKDPLLPDAIRIVCQYDRASSSLLQRKLSIGFNRAARIIELLEEIGVVGPGEGPKPRDVIIKNPEQILTQLEA